MQHQMCLGRQQYGHFCPCHPQHLDNPRPNSVPCCQDNQTMQGIVGWSSLCFSAFAIALTKSTWSPCGVPPLWGLYRKSLRTSWGLLGDSLGTGRTSAKLRLIPKESLGTPQRLLRDSLDSLGTPWDYLGTSQQRVAQCNDLIQKASISCLP